MKWLNKLVLKIAINKLINYLKSIKMKSTKTTIVGIVGGLAIILTQVYHALDADPATVLDFEAIVGALALMGIGWFARDKDVTSEQQGLK